MTRLVWHTGAIRALRLQIVACLVCHVDEEVL